MTRETRLTLAYSVPVFVLVVLTARAIWLAYVASLNESDLHLHVFDHPVRNAVGFWGTCLIVSVVVARLVVVVVTRMRRIGDKTELSNEL